MTDRSSIEPTIRRLWLSDRAAVLAYFVRLDPQTRADRFMGALSDAAALAYAERATRADGLMFGAFVDGELRALGELRPMDGRRAGLAPGLSLGPEAEAAFAVEREFRRVGLGQALFRRIAAAARSRGVRDLHVRCLSWNGPMRGLAAKVGADLRPVGAETDGALRLPRSTPISLWSAGMAEAVDFTLALAAAADPHRSAA